MCSSYLHLFVQVLRSHLPINISLNAPQNLLLSSTRAAAAHRFLSSKATEEPRACTSTKRPGEQLDKSQSSSEQMKKDKQYGACIKTMPNRASVIYHRKRANTAQKGTKGTAETRQPAFTRDRDLAIETLIFKESKEKQTLPTHFIFMIFFFPKRRLRIKVPVAQ